MLFDAQDAAGLQGLERVAEGLLGDAAGHPVMQVAQEQHHIGRTGRRHRARGRAELGELDLAIQLGVGLDPLPKRTGQRDGRWCRGLYIGGVIGPAGGGQEWRDNVGIPPGAGPELTHGSPRLDAPKGQALGRMAPDVASLVRG